MPVRVADIRRAQEEIDTVERRRQAYRMSIFDKKIFMSPERVKGIVEDSRPC